MLALGLGLRPFLDFNMIIRNKKAYLESDTFSFNVSLSEVDVRKQMKEGFALMAKCGEQYALSTPWTEQDIKTYLSNTIFQQYPPKYQEQMCKWAFKLCLRKKYISQSGNKENLYFLSDLLGHKVGRPCKDAANS